MSHTDQDFQRQVKALSSHQGMQQILFVGADPKFQLTTTLCQIPWSRIYTTKKDLNPQLFCHSDRECIPIKTEEDFKKNKKMSRKSPLLIYLSQEEIQDREERSRQRRNRQGLIASMTSAMEPVIHSMTMVGYSPQTQGELKAEELLDAFATVGDCRITLFGCAEEIAKDPDLQHMEAKFILKIFTQDLRNALAVESNSWEEDSFPEDDLEDQRLLYLGERLFRAPKQQSKEFAPFGRLLTLKDLSTQPIHKGMLTDYFYKFLKNSPISPQWYGHNPRNSLAFPRKIQEKNGPFYKTVYSMLAGEPKNKPIILSGQSGAGKSITLSALAYRVFWEKQYPVLYITNPNLIFSEKKPPFQALDNLLGELVSAKRVLIIFDCSIYNLERNPNNLRRLIEMLENRGRKVVIVASAMENCTKQVKKFHQFQLPINLDEEEKRAFASLMKETGRLSDIRVEKWLKNYSEEQNLLAILYRQLYQIQGELEQGIYAEVGKGVNDTVAQMEDLPDIRVEAELTATAQAFLSAGFLPQEECGGSVSSKEIIENLKPFFKSLAVASLFHLRIPTAMAMRLLNIPQGEGASHYRDLIFRSPWVSNFQDNDFAPGEFSIGFRAPIDAKLYLNSLGVLDKDHPAEVGKIIKTLAREDSEYYHSEVIFLANLIRILGPNSESDRVSSQWNFLYRPHCLPIVEALDYLFQQGIVEPDLVIQHICYLREINSKEENQKAKLHIAVKIASQVLEEHQRVTPRSIEWNPGAMDSILVERVLSEISLESQMSTQEILELGSISTYEQRYQWLTESINRRPDNSYLYTTLLSAFMIYQKQPEVSVQDKLSAVAQIMELVDKVESDIPRVEENQYYQEKKASFLDVFDQLTQGNTTKEYIQKLLEEENPVGAYIQVRTLLKKEAIKLGTSIQEQQVGTCKQVLDVLETHRHFTRHHSGCQSIRLRVLWLSYTRQPIFYFENQCTKLTEAQWKELKKVCEEIQGSKQQWMKEDTIDQGINYVYGLSMAQLGDYAEAENQWKKVSEDSFFSTRRQRTWHILSHEDGTPKEFKGSFSDRNNAPTPDGKIWVDELRRPVVFRGLGSIGKADATGSVEGLCIGTSYRGYKTSSITWVKRQQGGGGLGLE